MRTAMLLAGALAIGCSTFQARIEVYDGTGLNPPPADDPMALFGRVEGAVVQAGAAKAECTTRMREAEQRTEVLAGDLERLRAAEQEVSKSATFVAAGKRLATGWETFLRELAKAKAEERAKLVGDARGALGRAATHEVEGVNVVLALHARVRKALTRNAEHAALANALATAIVCDETECAAAEAKLATLLDDRGSAATLAALADAAKEAAGKDETWAKSGDDELTEMAAAIREAGTVLVDCRELDAPLERMTAARDELAELVVETSKARQAQRAVQKALAAARDYVDAAQQPPAQLEQVSAIDRAVTKKLDGADPLLQLAIAKGFAPSGGSELAPAATLRQHLQQWVDTIGQPLEVGDVARVASLSSSFRLDDPNLRVITGKKAEAHWNPLPIDELRGHAEGKAQFVIVQDSPVSYRVKELHADPTKNVDLAFSIGDIGIELIGAIAGVDDPEEDDDEEGEPAPPCDGDAEARTMEKREREVIRTIAALQRDLDRALRTVDGRPRDKVDSNTLASLRGTIAGHIARLQAIRKHALASTSTACKEPEAAEGGKDDASG